MSCAKATLGFLVSLLRSRATLCLEKTDNGPDGGLGQYAQYILRVWLSLPRYFVQHHLPSFRGSLPFSMTLCAALSILKMALPPHCRLSTGGVAVVELMLRCDDSHHSLVLEYNLSCSGTVLQSMFVSAMPNISKSRAVNPCLSSCSLKLSCCKGRPPIFKNPMRKIFFLFFNQIITIQFTNPILVFPLIFSCQRN